MLAWIAIPDPEGRGAAGPRQARHFFGLPADVDVDELETLALSRFGGARWELAPAAANPAHPAAAVAAPGAPGILRLSRHTTLTGPYAPPRGFPPGTTMVFDVVCPRERGEAPFPEGADRDGIGRAFPAGVPIREEERVINWLIAAARRLGGSVRADLDAQSPGVDLVPDPGAAVDMFVYSDVWLEPQAAVALIQRTQPNATLNTEGTPWLGPPPGIDEIPLYHGEPIDPRERVALHAAAEQTDLAALAEPQVLNGYGILVDLALDGYVAVEVGGSEALPLLLRSVPWASAGAVMYRVHWEPSDVTDWQRERPSPEHVAARARAADVVTRIVRVLHRAVGGEIADEYDFLLDPADL